MSPPLPIPSKAALRALRGLILGTSCSLALIAEDRRRRIDHALRILENGERVKAARSYRAAGAAAVLEEEATLLDSGLFRLHPRPTPTKLGAGTRAVPVESQVLSEPTRSTPLQQHEQNYTGTDRLEDDGGIIGNAPAPPGEIPIAVPFGRPVVSLDKQRQNHQHKPAWGPAGGQEWTRPAWGAWVSNQHAAVRQYEFPSNDKIVAMIREACATQDAAGVGKAVQRVQAAYSAEVAPGNHDRTWVGALALLCRACQGLGQREDATRLLGWVVDAGEVDEGDYFAFGAVELIGGLIPREIAGGVGGRQRFREEMDVCVRLFMVKFTEKPGRREEGVFELGRRLMEAEFGCDRLAHVVGLFWRCVAVGGEGDYGFTEWTVGELQRRGGYRSAVRIFLTQYARMAGDKESLERIAGVVVECVEDGHNYRASLVLRALVKLAVDCGTRLKAVWVMRLLQSFWEFHHVFVDLEALFDELKGVGLEKLMFNPGGAVRVMVEIALDGGDEVKADRYVAEGRAVDPRFGENTRLIGIFARYYAKAGCWDRVLECFERIAERKASPAGERHRSEAFVPVLKIYAAEHGIKETEEFFRYYVDVLGVAPSSNMVTLVARLYGSVRDFRSLSQFLLYCGDKVPEVDAKFSMAIVTSCRKSKMPFRDLRTLFGELKDINPGYVDEGVEQVMLDAGTSDSKLKGGFAKGRIHSLRLNHVNPALSMRAASAESVHLAMKQKLAMGCPALAFTIYRRAASLRMPFSERCLRLAVLAQLKLVDSHGRDKDQCYNKAWHEIVRQQRNGYDVNGVINAFLAYQLKRIVGKDSRGEDFRRGEEPRGVASDERDAVFRSVMEKLEWWEGGGLAINNQTLDQAGLACLRAGHFRGALHFARKSAESMGQGVCYNTTNFRVFMLAYAELVDVKGLKETVEQVVGRREYREDFIVRETFRLARRRIKSSVSTEGGGGMRGLALRVVEEGLGRINQAREELRAKRREFEGVAVGFMRRAMGEMDRAVVVDAELEREVLGGENDPLAELELADGEDLVKAAPRKEMNIWPVVREENNPWTLDLNALDPVGKSKGRQVNTWPRIRDEAVESMENDPWAALEMDSLDVCSKGGKGMAKNKPEW